MLEARAFVDSLGGARTVLEKEQAIFRGEYFIRDTIYRSKNPKESLTDVFLRLREVRKNIWNEKPIVVAIKKTECKAVGKHSHIPVKIQYDSLEEARNYIQEMYGEQFEYAFDFERIGWQYDIGANQVDLEIVNDTYCTIECKSETEEGLRRLTDTFGITDILIDGPSVVVIEKLLKA